ncbi:MAG: hypothetical protein Q9M91_04320 [Candidatus Dojkabacteria bacterium]|nr:hypothetical protein [Candidatus Dojkabacteria bacterium]
MKKIYNIIDEIINNSKRALNSNLDDIDIKNISSNYVAIQSTDNNDYDQLIELLSEIGKLHSEKKTGIIFQLESSYKTDLGDIELVRVRKPDPNGVIVGFADFNITNYEEFKAKYLDKSNFSIQTSSDGKELIQLKDDAQLIFFPKEPIKVNNKNMKKDDNNQEENSQLIEELKNKNLQLMADSSKLQKKN